VPPDRVAEGGVSGIKQTRIAVFIREGGSVGFSNDGGNWGNGLKEDDKSRNGGLGKKWCGIKDVARGEVRRMA